MAIGSPITLLLSVLVATSAFAVPPVRTPSPAALELARVNGEPVTDRDLENAFVGKHGGHTVFLGGEAEARRFLEIVINERLLIQEAYNLELDTEPAIKAQVDEFRDRKAAERLVKLEVDEKCEPSDAEIRAAWELAKDLYLAREIVVDTRSEAEAIRRSIMSGGDFEVFARDCSTARSRNRAGTMQPFTWGSLTAAIEQAVSALDPGELSPVIRTADGWMLIKLIDRRDADRPELSAQTSARIAAKLRERKAEALSAALSTRLWRDYGAAVVLHELSASKLARLLREEGTARIATWTGGGLSVKEVFTPGELRMFASLPQGRAAERIETALRAAVNTSLIRLEARKLKIDEDPSVVEAVGALEAQLIEKALYAGHVLTTVKVDEKEVRDAYELQKASLIVPERRRVAHIAVATKEEAQSIRTRIQKGEDFGDLLKKHSLDTPSIKSGGDLGWIEKGRVAETYDPLFRLAEGGVGEPIGSEKAWHVIRVTGIEPERPLSYDEVKERLRMQILEKKKHDAREFWIEKLRQAGEIEVLDAGIKAFVAAQASEK